LKNVCVEKTMGCFHSKCSKSQRISELDWKAVDKHIYKRTKPLYLTPDQYNQVTKVFEKFVEDEPGFAFSVFSRLLTVHHEIAIYFDRFSEAYRLRPLLTIEDRFEYLLMNAEFLVHMAAFTESIMTLVRSLHQKSKFYEECNRLIAIHRNLPGVSRIYFRTIVEIIDTLFVDLAVGRQVRYTRSEQKSTRTFLIYVYSILAKNLPIKTFMVSQSRHASNVRRPVKESTESKATGSRKSNLKTREIAWTRASRDRHWPRGKREARRETEI